MSISGFVPAMDVYQTKDYVIVETSLPGMKPEDVNVVIENDILTIQGSMEKKTEVDEKTIIVKKFAPAGFIVPLFCRFLFKGIARGICQRCFRE